MSTAIRKPAERFEQYLKGSSLAPLFVQGDTLEVLKELPSEVADCCMTSPPYWGQRSYSGGGVGLESHHMEYIARLAAIFKELRRVLKPTGSFWLNIGDTYTAKRLIGIPWRLAIALTDEQGWILRNSVVWNKVKGGPDNSLDKLRNVHENVFHFVKSAKYFYDVDAIRKTPAQAKVVNGAVVSATGVSGIRYKRQIELSTALNPEEKRAALAALGSVLGEIQAGRLADFRMIIRGQQRTTHSDSAAVSGRARELEVKGYYFLRYNPNGTKPSDVWDILPEDTQKRQGHYAAYPEDLCRIPIIATCPAGGVVIDPFSGTGTTSLVAYKLGRRSIGIDISPEYIRHARARCRFL